MCTDRELESFRQDAITRFGEERGMEIFAWYCQRRAEQYATAPHVLALSNLNLPPSHNVAPPEWR